MAQTRTQQIVQEDQYDFPYHYIPSNVEGNFKLFISWSWGINYLLSMEFLIERLKDEDFSKLLDIGCGDGRFVRELSVQIGGKEFVGVDISEHAINLARALNPNLEFHQLDILQDSLPVGFDIITLVEVLEHIPLDEVQLFLNSIAGLQKSGDRLYITVPHDNRTVQKKHFQHFNSLSLTKQLMQFYEIREFVFFDKRKWYLKYIRGLLKNRFFILNHTVTLNKIYRYYKERLFLCSESQCSRMFAVAIKK